MPSNQTNSTNAKHTSVASRGIRRADDRDKQFINLKIGTMQQACVCSRPRHAPPVLVDPGGQYLPASPTQGPAQSLDAAVAALATVPYEPARQSNATDAAAGQ